MRPYYQDDYVTIYHGDCLELLPTVADVECVVTDPPYGTKTDQREEWMVGEFGNVMPLALPLIRRALVANGAFYCFTSWTMLADWALRYQQYFKLQNILVWDKGRHSGCYSATAWQFCWEGIYFGLKGSRKIRKYMPDVIRGKAHGLRAAMEKPTDVVGRLIEASTGEGHLILDPFMGSGSTLRAAKNLKRKAIGIEIEEKYCEIAAKRMRQEILL